MPHTRVQGLDFQSLLDARIARVTYPLQDDVKKLLLCYLGVFHIEDFNRAGGRIPN